MTKVTWQDWDASSLPKPLKAGSDMEEAKRRLDEFGYVVLTEALSTSETAALRQRLDEQAAAERALGQATLVTPSTLETVKLAAAMRKEGKALEIPRAVDLGGKFHEQFVLSLFNKGEEFWGPLLKEEVLDLTAHLLGSEFLVSSWLATLVNPGCPLMGLHTDQWYMNQPHPRSSKPGVKSGDINRAIEKPTLSNDPDGMITPCYSVQTIWMLTDFTEESGATRIIPKSGRSGVVPEAAVPHPYRSVAAEAPAGSVLLYDARMWHSSGEHKGDTTRYALHGTFIGPQIRQMENFFLSLLPEVKRKLPKRLLEMLGYKIWWGYGRLDNLAQMGLVDFDHVPLGRLSLKN